MITEGFSDAGMNYPNLTKIDTAHCILFLGSGFSAECTNISGNHVPIGDQLRNHLATLLKDEAYKSYSLREAATAAGDDPNIDLYQVLYNLFTIEKIPETHKSILALPWRRIYTTNYDDSVQSCSHQRKTFNYEDPKPRKIPQDSVIFLHGQVGALTRDNVSEQLVLGDESYIKQHSGKENWCYEELKHDIQFSDAVFFLGYSLKDDHITAQLMQNPETEQKTFFITKDTPDTPTKRRLEKYGSICPIGISEFSSFIRRIYKSEISTTKPEQLKTLRYLDPNKDKATLSRPTASEVRNLLTFGQLHFKRLIASFTTNHPYAIHREKYIEEAISRFPHYKTLIVDANLGNGKTVFLQLLAVAMSQHGYKCFICRNDDPQNAVRDCDALKTMGKIAIFFDSYDSALTLMGEFLNLENAVFVVTVRSSVRDAQLYEIDEKFPKITYLNIDTFKDNEKTELHDLVQSNGLFTTDYRQKMENARDLKEHILTIFDNSIIKDSISKEIIPFLNQHPDIKKMFFISYIIHQAGRTVDSGFIFNIMDKDPYAILAKVKDIKISTEIFSLQDNSINIPSPIFSKYIIDNYFPPEEILPEIESIILHCARHYDKLTYSRMAGALLKISFLKRVLQDHGHQQHQLEDLFERLKDNNTLNTEPLFWLQYAILAVDQDKDLAERFIVTAYEMATRKMGFKTYQIDTFALFLYLKIETDSRLGEVTHFADIRDKIEKIIGILKEKSRRYHAINVLDGLKSFVEKRKMQLTPRQNDQLIGDFSRVIDALDNLPREYQAISGSNDVKKSVCEARLYLSECKNLTL